MDDLGELLDPLDEEGQPVEAERLGAVAVRLEPGDEKVADPPAADVPSRASAMVVFLLESPHGITMPNTTNYYNSMVQAGGAGTAATGQGCGAHSRQAVCMA
jgi:hypothetical protein